MLMFCIPALNVAQVTIASQRRYVGYWGKLLACSSENQLGLPQIELPETRHRELRRIRLYDTLSNDHVKFVISELKKVKVENL
jgi:phosphatidylinositol-3,4,5-trisphosphate 3-phosphatase/dual-specificity protein phosphatase PTEN